MSKILVRECLRKEVTFQRLRQWLLLSGKAHVRSAKTLEVVGSILAR